METADKLFYKAPSTLVIEVKSEASILQVSGEPQFHGFGNEELLS